jgi:hypothetical protein
MKVLKLFVGLVVGVIVFALVFNGLNFLGKIVIHNFVQVLDSEFGRNMIALKTIVSFIGAVYMGRKVYRYYMFGKRSLKNKKTTQTTSSDLAEVSTKRKFTREQEIAYEMAKELINDVEGIMFRYMYWLSQIGKDQTEAEKAHIAWIEERRSELVKEKRNLDLHDEDRNNKISDVYAKLAREYFEMPVKSDREIAEKGLPEKYVTTKVDLSEFDRDKGA